MNDRVAAIESIDEIHTVAEVSLAHFDPRCGGARPAGPNSIEDSHRTTAHQERIADVTAEKSGSAEKECSIKHQRESCRRSAEHQSQRARLFVKAHSSARSDLSATRVEDQG
jgi:hypothetical protein